jgi:hypothetical protein
MSEIAENEQFERARYKPNEHSEVYSFLKVLLLQLSLMEMTRTEAQRLLNEGEFERSIPAALQSLRFSIDIYGTGTVELVPSYLLLGEASIGSSTSSFVVFFFFFFSLLL